MDDAKGFLLETTPSGAASRLAPTCVTYSELFSVTSVGTLPAGWASGF